MKRHDTSTQQAYEPIILRLFNIAEKDQYLRLRQDPNIEVFDSIEGQLRELIKSNHPAIKIADKDYPEYISQHLGDTPMEEYGVWVYYPWSRRLVHLLDKEEFVAMRTNRNQYKITKEEQALLETKKIGVIGLSVGQSIALTLAMERVCGELRLADFDTAELTNLNRIRTGVHNLGLHKTIIAAREIAEIDPYLKVKIYSEGITDKNIDAFFMEGGKLDVLVEVCDGLDIKITSRFKAKELGIPVVMDTNDRGMLDVERFDLEPDRPILHGLAEGLNPANIKGLSNEDKVPYILRMLNADHISTRLKASMMEVEQSINTWPQLASSVVLGGALTTDTVRRILLDEFHESGRYYVDFEEFIADKVPQKRKSSFEDDCPAELTLEDMLAISSGYQAVANPEIQDEVLKEIVKAAIAAPSGGNSQPWKFLYKQGNLYIFHDIHFSHSLLDFNHLGSYVAFGAMLENIGIKAAELNLSVKENVFPLKNDKRLIAVLSFEANRSNHPFTYLSSSIFNRHTNRTVTERTILPQTILTQLQEAAASISGARLLLYDSPKDIELFAELMTNTERLRFIHPIGHYDTFAKELRFTPEQVLETLDGMDIETLNMTNSERAALQVAKDPKAISLLHEWQKGHAFKKISRKPVLAASCIGMITMDGDSQEDFLRAGRAVERVWLEATHLGVSFQPVSQAIFFLQRIKHEGGKHFNEYELSEFNKIKDQLMSLIPDSEVNRHPMFMFRFLKADMPAVRALRKPVEKVLYKG